MKSILISLVMLTAVGFANSASAGLPEVVDYLKTQTPDAWITQALIASGETNLELDYLKSVAPGAFNPTNDYAKAILALTAAGKNPSAFGDIDYVAKLKSYYDGTQMGDANLLNDDIWSILALAAIKETASAEAVSAKDFLLANQNADGGWGYDLTGGSDTNDTAAAIIALKEMGFSSGDQVIVNALDYLWSLQNTDGGFPYNPAWGSDSDSGSDAWVICALNKLGQDPTALDQGGNNPLTNLESLQDSDGGFWWQDPALSPAFNNKAMTPFAVIALAGRSFPIKYYEIPQPTPPPAPAPGPSSGGGSVIAPTPISCQSVEYDVWQEACFDGWQYRNVLNILPANCTLTAEQEEERKRACVAAELIEEDDSLPIENEIADLEPEVLGIKIDEATADPADKITMEANLIVDQGVDFSAVGTDSTVRLGAGERAGVINSFKSTFGREPETQADWEEIIRISTNQKPLAVSLAAEEKAKNEFKKVYGREVNLENPNGQTAIDMMAYGLRPDRRDLDLERTGINVFVKTYNYLPLSALDWDTVRAIAYSGVSF